MKRQRITSLSAALLLAVAAMAQPAAQRPAEGTFYLLNTGQQTYLTATSDGQLALGAAGKAVTLAKSGTRYTMTIDGRTVGGATFLTPTADGQSSNTLWDLRPVASASAPATYTLGNMLRETNANAHLYFSRATSALASTATLPDASFADGAWQLVSEADYTANALTLDEKATAYTAPAYVSADHPAAVTLLRKLKAGSWNSLCLPFAIGEGTLKQLFGADSYLVEFSDYEEATGTIVFSIATGGVKAGVPYMLWPEKVATDGSYEFGGVEQLVAEPVAVTHGACTCHATFTATSAPAGSYVISNNLVYRLTKDNPMNAFRTYFVENTAEGQAAPAAWRIGSAPTGIDAPTSGTLSGTAADAPVYDTAGRRVATGADGAKRLPRGLYVTKGKTTIKK